uniref:THAP-type domain-containing protein n=1 Tax=Gadus morhua TaxID=8049 RepID=A0A8C5CIY1_GADMO
PPESFTCSNSSKFNKGISFHSFPVDSALRAEWVRTIRRDDFNPTKNTRVCSRHFNATDIIVTASGLRRLQKGTFPVLFEWNGYERPVPRPIVWDRRPRPDIEIPDSRFDSEMEVVTVSHIAFKAMIGMAPHGAITFVSGLYVGSMSDREIFKHSGIAKLLQPDMGIMVDKGFLVDNLAGCKVYRPAFLSHKKQMSREDVRQTQSIARLRVHVERCIRRIKENKLFDKEIKDVS